VSTWYLRRAVAWPLVVGWSVAGAACALTALIWDGWAPLGLPLATVAAVAAASFAFDDPALAVTAQAPRGAWACRRRVTVAVAPPIVAWCLIAALPAELRGSIGDWALVIGGLAGAAIGVALAASALLVARPGAEVAAAAVLCGLAPLVVGSLMDVGQAYPQPRLSAGWRILWIDLAVVGAGLVAFGLRRRAR
jgi:hypothetical protein